MISDYELKRFIERQTQAFESIAESLSKLATVIDNGVLSMRDVDRAKVYSEHLGEKLRTGEQA